MDDSHIQSMKEGSGSDQSDGSIFLLGNTLSYLNEIVLKRIQHDRKILRKAPLELGAPAYFCTRKSFYFRCKHDEASKCSVCLPQNSGKLNVATIWVGFTRAHKQCSML